MFWEGFYKRADDLKAPIRGRAILEDFDDFKRKGEEVEKKLRERLAKVVERIIDKNPRLAKADKVLKGLGAVSGLLAGTQLGAAPGFLIRSRFEDKFKEKEDRDLKDQLIAHAPVVGGVGGALLGTYLGYSRGGVLGRLKKMAALKSSVDLKPHQEHFVTKLIENDGSLLAAHATGTGKTLTGIAGFEKLKTLGKAKRAVVVVPASLRENFIDNIKKYTNSKHVVFGPKGERSSKDVGDKSTADYNIISYELFRDHGDKILEGTGADTLILDEIHRARGTEGVTYNKLRDLRSKFRNAITLTGSVVNNEPNEVVPLLDVTHTPTGHKLVSKSFFDKLFVRKDAVTRGIFKPKVYVEKNIRNKDKLGAYLRGKVHFVSHEALEKDMPKRNLESELIPMTKDQQALYNYSLSSVDPLTRWKIKNNIPVTQREAKDAFSQLMQARQVSTDPSILDKRLQGKDPYEYSPKVKKVVDDLKSHLEADESHKSVIYGNLIHGQLNAVEEALRRKGIPYARFFGMGQEGMTAKSRPKEIEDFKQGKKRVLLISGAGAEGIDLKNTTMLQMLEGHYNPERIQQAEARIRRLGSFAHLPPEKRQILIKRYMSSPSPSKLQKFYGAIGIGAGDTGVDKWIYSIAERKDKLNKDFREALDKVPTEKTAEEPFKPIRIRFHRSPVDSAIHKAQEGFAASVSGYMARSVGGALGTMVGTLPAKILEKRRDADVEKQLKQLLLDKGKESLVAKRHYPKILAESKLDERMIDASAGIAGLAAATGLMGFISPKATKVLNKPVRLAMKGLEKAKILGPKATTFLGKLNKDEIGATIAATGITGALIGAVSPSLQEFAKTKIMQKALTGRDEDLDRGIKIYEDKLRKKLESKYKGSKSFVQEVDTKRELGLDIID